MYNLYSFQVLHYVEKPSTFVSSIVNSGAYLFTPEIFDHLDEVFQANHCNELMYVCMYVCMYIVYQYVW